MILILQQSGGLSGQSVADRFHGIIVVTRSSTLDVPASIGTSNSMEVVELLLLLVNGVMNVLSGQLYSVYGF